jgi:hypothetical protein
VTLALALLLVALLLLLLAEAVAVVVVTAMVQKLFELSINNQRADKHRSRHSEPASTRQSVYADPTSLMTTHVPSTAPHEIPAHAARTFANSYRHKTKRNQERKTNPIEISVAVRCRE